MPKQFTLGKKERLKSRKLTEQLFSEGKKFSVAPIRVLYLLQDAEEPLLQLGVSASSKVFKKAVDRNRIKRLLREAWRLQKNELWKELQLQKKRLFVFLIYTGRELPEYREILSKSTKVIEKLRKFKND